MFPFLTATDFNTLVTVVVGLLLVMLFTWSFDKKKGPRDRR